MKKILYMLLAGFILIAGCGCQNSNDGNNPVGDNSSSKTPDPERAMDNFVRKLDEGNYLIANEGKLSINAYSPEQVTFIYDMQGVTYAFMTKDNETFNGYIQDDVMDDVSFYGPGTALENLSDILPNGWYEMSGGNMWELFYNNVDDPLEFTSYEDEVKLTLLHLAGYADMALSAMEEVHVRLDKEDPDNVQFTAKIGDVAMIHYDDLDLTLQFGKGTSDANVEKWLKNPVYPPTRSGWTKEDLAQMDLVFMKGYAADTIPFPTFASYALIFDENAYRENTEILLKDAHGTEADLEGYIEQLKGFGYEPAEVQTEDGTSVTVYRKLLREKYHAYAQVYPYFDNGFTLEGGMYYDNPSYEGLDSINKVLVEKGFAEMDETDLINNWKAVDSAGSRSEGWAYFFDYDLYMPIIQEYSDRDAVEAYLQNYGSKLKAIGYRDQYTQNGDSFETEDSKKMFRYTFSEEDNTVLLEFKSENNYTPEQVKMMLSEHDIPEADIHGAIAVRNLAPYYHEIAEFKGLYLTVYQPFKSNEEAEAFLDEYTERLVDLDYLPMDPSKINSYRQHLYYNLDLGKYVAFDYMPDDDEPQVYFEFVSSEPEEPDALENLFGSRH